MSTDATWQQAKHFLELVVQKGVPKEVLQELYSSGLLSDLLETDVSLVDREDFRRVLSLVPLEPRYRSIEIPEMVGKPRSEVYEYLKNTYGNSLYLAKIPNDLNSLPDELKDGNFHCFFGSILDLDGECGVPCAYWDGCGWARIALCFSITWQSRDRVVLVES